MGNTNNYANEGNYADGEINSMNGCGIDETSKIFYESGRHAFQESPIEELEDLMDLKMGFY